MSELREIQELSLDVKKFGAKLDQVVRILEKLRKRKEEVLAAPSKEGIAYIIGYQDRLLKILEQGLPTVEVLRGEFYAVYKKYRTLARPYFVHEQKFAFPKEFEKSKAELGINFEVAHAGIQILKNQLKYWEELESAEDEKAKQRLITLIKAEELNLVNKLKEAISSLLRTEPEALRKYYERAFSSGWEGSDIFEAAFGQMVAYSTKLIRALSMSIAEPA